MTAFVVIVSIGLGFLGLIGVLYVRSGYWMKAADRARDSRRTNG